MRSRARSLISLVMLAIAGPMAAAGQRAEDLANQLQSLIKSQAELKSRTDAKAVAEAQNVGRKINDVLNQLKVIYGPDDRIDYYRATPGQKKACDATVALVETSKLVKNLDGSYRIAADKIGEERSWCSDEPFYDQPAPAFCSGFVVAEDRIATAGHCIEGTAGDSCKGTSFIFGFNLNAPGANPLASIPADNVYECATIVDGTLGGSNRSDWRVVKVDRKLVGRTPLTVRTDPGWIANGTGVTVIGYPVGLPAKIAGNASVRDSSSDAFFVANLDTYGGNSGSAVFNSKSIADGNPIVEGILVRGETDFEWNTAEACYRSNRCSDTGCRGEDVTRISEILGALPKSVAVAVNAK